ncbi:MAG: eL32 family ribosomal protein [Candidatus Diapherotrites archaeon]|nr:hypothetical protein [Candidatus Micrarchaeota archaeon]
MAKEKGKVKGKAKAEVKPKAAVKPAVKAMPKAEVKQAAPKVEVKKDDKKSDKKAGGKDRPAEPAARQSTSRADVSAQRREERRAKVGRVVSERPKRSDEVKKLAAEIRKNKNKKPIFRGRFGKKWMRKKSKAKWNKWRVTRGIDIRHNAEDGAMPKPGYGTARELKFMHPSGYEDVLVRNVTEIKAIGAAKGKGNEKAVRIASGVGRKKRNEIIVIANKMKLKVINA